MAQRNNHARSKKQKRKLLLKLKNFWARVTANRNHKRIKAIEKEHRTDAATIKGVRARDVAREASINFPNETRRYPNQRQRRKRLASNPHLRNKK